MAYCKWIHGLALFLLAGLVCVSPVRASNVYVDQVVAVVNGQPILQTELQSASDLGVAGGDILERKIEDVLVRQFAERQGLTIQDAEIEETIANIARQNNVTEDQLFQRLLSDGLSQQDYRDLLAEQLLRMRIVQREIEPRIRIDDADLVAYMKQNLDQFGNPPAAGLYLYQGQTAQVLEAFGCQALADCKESFQGMPAGLGAASLQPIEISWLQLAPEVREWVAASPQKNETRIFVAPDDNFTVIQFLYNLPGTLRPLEQVRDDVFEALRRERLEVLFQDWLLQLKQAALIERSAEP